MNDVKHTAAIKARTGSAYINQLFHHILHAEVIIHRV